jgi:hypothetical protein
VPIFITANVLLIPFASAITNKNIAVYSDGFFSGTQRSRGRRENLFPHAIKNGVAICKGHPKKYTIHERAGNTAFTFPAPSAPLRAIIIPKE